MNSLTILNHIKAGNISQLKKIEELGTFYEATQKKALKLCINHLSGEWSDNDESYFKMLCYHKKVTSRIFIKMLKESKTNQQVAALWIEFVNYSNSMISNTKSFLYDNLD